MFPPMPGGPMAQAPGAPPPAAGANPAALLGPPGANGAPLAEASQPAPSPQQMAEGFMMEIRDLTMRVDGLATQYPESAEDFEIAKQALINGMTKCLMGFSSTEPQSAPNLVG